MSELTQEHFIPCQKHKKANNLYSLTLQNIEHCMELYFCSYVTLID